MRGFEFGVPADAETLPFIRYDSDNRDDGRLGREPVPAEWPNSTLAKPDIGLAVLEEGRDICCVGKGGTSSGEVSKRATRSLKEVFLDLNVFGTEPEGLGLTASHCVCWVFTESFRPLTEFLPDLGPRSSFTCVDAKLDFRLAYCASSWSFVVVRIAS